MSSANKPVIKKIQVTKRDMEPDHQVDINADIKNYDADRNVGFVEAMGNNLSSFNPLSSTNRPGKASETEAAGPSSSATGAGGGAGETADTGSSEDSASKIKLIHVNRPVVNPTAVQHASKHFDFVLGIDIHWTQIPPPPSFMIIPLPLPHPFVGIVFDIMDYITINITVPALFRQVFPSLPENIPLGGSIFVHGRHKATTTTSVIGVLIPFRHLTGMIPVYFIVSPVEAPNEGEVYYGSETVLAQGTKLSGNQPQHVLTCMGFPFGRTMLPAMPQKPKKNPLAYFAFYANFASMYVQINTSGPVLVGGPFVPHLYTLGEMAMRFAGMFLMKKLTGMIGKGMQGGLKLINNKLLKSGPLSKFKLANALSKRLCAWGLEPVNFVTGAMMFEWDDFQVGGSTSFTWKNAWYSDQAYDRGLLGNGVFNNHDLYIIPDETSAMALWIHPEDYQPLPIPIPTAQSEYFREQKIWQERPDENTWIIHYGLDTFTYQRFSHPDAGSVFRITEIFYSDGTRRNYLYEGTQGLLQRIVDVNSDTALELSWDDSLQKVNAIYYCYGLSRDLQVRYDYDVHGNLTHVWDQHNKAIQFVYDQHNRVVQRTNRNGMSYTWEYDQEGRVLHTTGLQGYQEGEIHYYPALGYNEVVYVQHKNKKERYYYDERDLLYLKVDAEGGETWYDYTEHLEMKLIGSPEGRTQGYSYDEHGYLKEYHTADGEIINYQYDAFGRLLERRVSSGADERWRYDAAGRLLQYIDPTNAVVVYRYHTAQYQPYESEDQAGIITTYRYSDRGQLLELKNSIGIEQHWRYDAYGRVVEFSPNPRNHNRWKRDKMGRVVLVKESGALDLTIHYDAYDLPVHISDGREEWLMSYTPMGSLKRQVRRDAQSHKKEAVLDFDYDAYENLRAIVNEKGETYTFERDGNDDVIAEIGFDGQFKRYVRDRDGLVKQQVDAAGNRTYFEYDLAGRLLHAHYPDGTWEAYQYDRSGLLARADNADSTVTFQRDALGKITEERQGEQQVAYQYDMLGRLVGLQSSLGATIDYAYDTQGQLHALTAGLENVQGRWRMEHHYNVQRFTQTRSMTGGINSRLEFDPTGRPIAQLVEVKDHGIQWDRDYEWSATGKLMQTLDRVSGGTVQFDYDLFGNLFGARYADGSAKLKNPDETGNLFENIKRSDRVYDKGGKLLRDKTWYYQYDALGNLVLKSKRLLHHDLRSADAGLAKKVTPSIWDADYQPSSYDRVGQPDLSAASPGAVEAAVWQEGDWAYHWQGNGMLKTVVRPDGSQISFEYDALGRRTAKIDVSNEHINRYIWDGNVLLHEWQYALSDRPSMGVDESGVLDEGEEPTTGLITWVYEPGSFSPVAKLVDGQRFSIINDYLGTPVQAYNEEGDKVWERELDIYGAVRKGSNDFVPFTYPGQYFDKETGLCYNRFRYYDPEVGTYISKDPIGLNGGMVLFGYVHDSNSWVDVFGLKPLSQSLGDYGEKWVKEALQNSDKYSRVFQVQNASGHGIDVIGMRQDGKFDIFEVKTNISGRVGDLSSRQLDADFFINDILGKRNISDFGLSRQQANKILNNLGDKRVVDVFVGRDSKGRFKVKSALVSDWDEVSRTQKAKVAYH